MMMSVTLTPERMLKVNLLNFKETTKRFLVMYTMLNKKYEMKKKIMYTNIPIVFRKINSYQ